MQTFPDCVVQMPDGKIMLCDGMNPVKVWDGLQASLVDAGLAAPATGVTLAAGSAKGPILGLYAAYIRYVDVDGNVSSLSPISTTVDVKKTGGTITAASDTSPIGITTSSSHGLTSGDIVRIEGVLGNTASNGTWEVTVVDADEFTLDQSVGNGAYTSAGTWTPGTSTIEYTSVPVPSSSKVVRKQILRNTDGQFNVFYVDVDTTSLATTSFTSSKSDDELADETAVPLLTEDGAIFANANDRPVNYKCVLAHHSGRMFHAVDRVYRKGCVKVTNASASVTGIGTAFTASLVGRFLFVDGATVSYEITAVNVTTQVLTLASVYAGSTSAYAAYAIRPAPADRRIIYYTLPGFPQSWSPTYGIELQEDGDEITGLMAKGSFLYILELRHIYRFTFQSDPAVDGFIYQSCQRGVINNRCWVQVEDQTYMLDRDGVHAFGGGQESEPVSQPIQKIFQTLEDSDYVINWDASELFHGCHFPTEEVVRWFVSMGSSVAPRHVIAFHTRAQRWWLEEYDVPVTASTLGLVGSARAVYLGSESLATMIASTGNLDGLDKNVCTTSGVATSADFCSISDDTASFSTAVAGLQVAITGGKGMLQRRTISEVDGVRLRVTQPWSIIPDDTSTYQIAGLRYRFLSQKFVWAEAQEESDPSRKIGMMYEPSTTASNAYLRIYEDQNKEPKEWKSSTIGNPEGVVSESGNVDLFIDLTKPIAYAQQRMPGHRDDDMQGVRRMAFQIHGVAGDEGVKFYSFIIDGVM